MDRNSYNQRVIEQWERKYSEPPNDPYEDMSEEEYEVLCEKADYEEGILYEKYERERKQRLGE